MTNLQDINLKELENNLIALGVTKDSAPRVIGYIQKDYANKLNRIEKEIDKTLSNIGHLVINPRKEKCRCDRCNSEIKQIISKEFTGK